MTTTATIEKNLTEEVKKALYDLRPFVSIAQLKVLRQGLFEEEGSFFKDKILELNKIVREMPRTYDQDGLGNDAIIYLHYFAHGADAYITEKDKLGDGTFQAFGMMAIQEREWGYIDIFELIKDDMFEIDLHWTPQTIAEMKTSVADLCRPK